MRDERAVLPIERTVVVFSMRQQSQNAWNGRESLCGKRRPKHFFMRAEERAEALASDLRHQKAMGVEKVPRDVEHQFVGQPCEQRSRHRVLPTQCSTEEAEA